MTAISYAAYKRARRPDGDHIPTAKHALDGIRHRARIDALLEDLDDHGRMERDGFQIKVKVDYEEYPEPDECCGDFSDTWQPGSLVNPKHHAEGGYSSWRSWESHAPYHYSPNCEGIAKYASERGYARHQAWLQEQRARRRDMEYCAGDREASYYYVTVTASRAGIELGYDSLHNIEAEGADDPYIREIIAELIPEAIDSANKALHALCATA